MRRPLLGLLLTATVVATTAVHVRAESPKEDAAEPATVVTTSVRRHRVIVYYFHTTYRCASCRAIEAYSREAIETACSSSARPSAVRPAFR